MLPPQCHAKLKQLAHWTGKEEQTIEYEFYLEHNGGKTKSVNTRVGSTKTEKGGLHESRPFQNSDIVKICLDPNNLLILASVQIW